MIGTLGADVAVVLLVHTVETDELEIVGGKAAGKVIGQVLFDGTVQIIAAVFQGFVAGKRGIGQLGARVGGSGHRVLLILSLELL